MIDPNEAPDGFVAAPSKHACAGCHFCDRHGDCTLMDFTCYPSQRKDGENVIFIPREKSNLAEFSNIGDLAEAMAEIERLQKFATVNGGSELEAELERWKSAHDHVCKELAACEEARDENAELCNKARADLITCRNELISKDNLIQKLKSQLTTALESIARMR